MSSQRVLKNNKFLAYRLGVLKRSYDRGMNSSTVENYDETHVMIDMDNGQVLNFKGTKKITYAEVASGRDCFTVCFRISGAGGGKIEKPVVIFQNPNSNYPIIGVPDNIEGIAYRTSPKGYLTQQLFAQYFSDSNIISSLSGNRARKLWFD